MPRELNAWEKYQREVVANRGHHPMTMTLAALLDELADYFDNKADAEIVDGTTHANKEMHLLSEVKAHIGIRYAVPDNSAWLIEAPGARWLAVRQPGVPGTDFHWTHDANAAVAFTSRESADGAMEGLRTRAPDLFAFEGLLGNAFPSQHVFCPAA
jgi:hypothetical protein